MRLSILLYWLTLLNFLDGHYLNLPVMNDAGEIVGMVDVLKLTYATLEQVTLTAPIPRTQGVACTDNFAYRLIPCQVPTVRGQHGTNFGSHLIMTQNQ